MQVEPMPNSEGEYRCWLSLSEQETLKDYYEDDLERQVAIRLMLHGLRADETQEVAKNHIRKLDAEEDSYKLRIPDGKTGFRECPISSELRTTIVALSSAKGVRGGRADEPVCDVTTKTLSRWVNGAVENIAEDDDEYEDEGDNWNHVTCHDLRRSWATSTYYQLSASDVAKSIIMRWGGWTDEATFEENYLGREPDELASELMHEAGLA